MKQKIGKRTLVIATLIIITTSLVGIGTTISYLSNESYATMAVEAPPVKMELYDTGSWRQCTTTPLSLGTMYGTESTDIDFKVTKLAPHDYSKTDYATYGPQIEGTFYGVLHCDQGISLDDLEQIIVDIDCPGTAHDVTLTWVNGVGGDFTPVVDGDDIEVEYPTEILWDQWGYYGNIEMMFSQYAYGDYTLTLQII